MRTARAAGLGRGGAMSRSTAAPISSADAGGGLDLEAGAGVVAVGRQRPGEQHARLGGFVGGVDLAPGADALLQRRRSPPRCRRGGAPARRAPRRPPRPARACRTVAPAPRARRRSRLAACSSPTARHALHVHRQHEDPALPREEARVGQRAGEAPHRRRRVALRQQQATSPRLAVVAEGDGLRERLLGAGQVAATDPDVHQLAVAPAGAVAVDRRAAPRTPAAPAPRPRPADRGGGRSRPGGSGTAPCSRRSTRARSSGSTCWSTPWPAPSRRAPDRSRSPRSTRSRRGSARRRAAWPARPPRRGAGAPRSGRPR